MYVYKGIVDSLFVTGFWKTDQDVTHEINRISMFKHLQF